MTIRIASAGLGHGSTAMIVASALREPGFPMLDHVSFADTGSERPETYEHRARFAEWLATRGIELVTMKKTNETGSLMQSVIDRIAGKRKSASPLPLHLENAGRALQGCTRDWKMRPLDKRMRSLVKGHDSAEVWIGYTIEEFLRVPAPSKYGWPKHVQPRYPLIENGWNRGRCVAYLREHLSWPVVASCCVMCPHRPTVGPNSFATLLESNPEQFDQVEAFDAAIRDGKAWGLDRRCYLSALRLPLREAIETASRQGNLFDRDDACDGGTCWT